MTFGGLTFFTFLPFGLLKKSMIPSIAKIISPIRIIQFGDLGGIPIMFPVIEAIVDFIFMFL